MYIFKGKFFSFLHNTRTLTQLEQKKREYFLTVCIITLWNSLPQDVVMVPGLEALKKGVDSVMEEVSIAGCKP